MTINRLNQGTTNQVLVKAISGQTTNLLELQDSSGSVVSSIGPTGALGGSLVPPASGLIHINTTSFSAVASQSVNDVFSATYDNYKIVITGVFSTVGELYIRMRVGGTDNSTASSYVVQKFSATGSTTGTERLTDTRMQVAVFDTSLVNGVELNVFNPFFASATGFLSANSRSSSGALYHAYAGTHNQTVSYDGFTISPVSGNMTGTIRVYGVKN
jgi:hypothetical protein